MNGLTNPTNKPELPDWQFVYRIRRLGEAVVRSELIAPSYRATLADALREIADATQNLINHNEYLEESLTAAVTGELPPKYTINQFLLAQRARKYNAWLEETKDAKDKTRDQGSNEEN